MSYYPSLFQKFKDDIKGTWKTMNEILNKIKKELSMLFQRW